MLPLLLLAHPGLAGQPGKPEVHELAKRPVYRVDVVEKITVAINYRHRSGSTRINFRGTTLLPRAEGLAKVESQRGYIEIEVEFKRLEPAIKFGAEYLTYVMWAITPEGRASNLGEVLVNKDGGSKLNVTTELQMFGMIVTAEPYFAVRSPSDLVVLENEVRRDTLGKIETINARFELLRRGQYQPLANPLMLTLDPKVPLELYEARNAVQIARASGAPLYARDTFLKAERSLSQAEAYLARKAGPKPVAMLAREAVQTAEDAREIAVRRQDEERLAKERQEAAEREAAARAAAEREAKRRAEAEAATKAEERRRAEAEQQAQVRAAEQSKLEKQLAAVLEAAKQAQDDAARAHSLLSEERMRWQNELQKRQSDEVERQQRLESLRKAELRLRLTSQISGVLPARQTDEGVVVDMPRELFEDESGALAPAGREKLAILAGFLLAHPGLQFALHRAPAAANGAVDSSIAADHLNAVERYLTERGLVGGIADGAPSRNASGLEDGHHEADGDAELRLVIFGDPVGLPGAPPEEP
ncbi:MAG: OmpA family protein [Bryobacteraceae bacterium]|nr:OmpA family protein [Bryobacteraceae bacterium]